MKQCSKCKILKKDSEFYTIGKNKNRLRNCCKICLYIQNKEIQLKIPIEIRREKKRIYKLKNYKKLKLKNKIYRNNPINKKRKKLWELNRLKTNPAFRIRKNLKTRLYHAVRGFSKSKKTMELLGCTVEELKKYLESKFLFEMSWSNYGKIWEIDHIQPCSSFDLSKEEEQIKCFHYNNLQPLWSKLNRMKSDNLDFQINPATIKMLGLPCGHKESGSTWQPSSQQAGTTLSEPY